MAFYGALRNNRNYLAGKDKPGQAGWIADRLLRLRALLNGQITSRRRPNSLIIGSWNIRHFDGGRPRLPESFHYIAEIVDHFDICAVQEVKNIDALHRLCKLLGPNWDFFVNDSSGGGRGNHERMAFIYNRNRVFFRNLIGEIVLPKDVLPGSEQVARTPFFASFQAGWFKFTLCSAHIVFEEKEGRPMREDEIRAVAKVLHGRSTDKKSGTDEVHVFLGDFNIESRDDAGMKALTDNGFHVPDIGPTSLTGTKYYDQIAFAGPSQEARFLNSGVIKFQEAVFTDDEAADYEHIARVIRDLKEDWQIWQAVRGELQPGEPYANWQKAYPSWRTHEMSDHLPIWIELEVDYSNEYLLKIAQQA